jgi:cytochrome c-type biogenesis protein CcmH/NrfG
VGRGDEAVRHYAQAVRGEPDRASRHAAWARARWRAAHRRWLDVESLDDGGPELVDVR